MLISMENFRALPSGRHRFELIFEYASIEEREQGMLAFSRYNKIVAMLASETGHSLTAACGVFSALSPNNGYLGNVSDASALMRANAAGRPITSFKVHTYNGNKRKAWEIACGAEPTEKIKAKKTLNFYLNILNPAQFRPVTIDGHMFNIWAGTKVPLKSRDPEKRITRIEGKLYDEIAEDVRTVAVHRRILPNQMQGILWMTWRRLHGVTKPQDAFWDLDMEKTGLGFTKL